MDLIDADQWDRQRRIRGWQQSAVEQSKCLVIGAGALGNEVVKLLLQLGVRNLAIVDYDTVVTANLNRCVFFTHGDAKKRAKKAKALAKAAGKVNPEAVITPVLSRVEQLDEVFFADFDCAFSCLDNLGGRLHANAHCYGKTPLIDGGTAGFNGKVQVVDNGSCLECGLSPRDYSFLWRKYSCTGEMLEFVDPKMPALPTTTSVVAGVMAGEFVKMAHSKSEPIGGGAINQLTQLAVERQRKPRQFDLPESGLAGKYWFYNGLTNESATFEVQKRASCPVHG